MNRTDWPASDLVERAGVRRFRLSFPVAAAVNITTYTGTQVGTCGTNYTTTHRIQNMPIFPAPANSRRSLFASPQVRVLSALRFTVAVAAGVLTVSSSTWAQDGGLPVGTKAPEAAVQMLDGKPANISQFIDKTPVVVEFWATWCPLCKKLEPQFKASQEKHGASVTFLSVGVPTNQSRERQQAYVTERMLGGTFVYDSAGNAMSAYKVPHTSHVLVLDKQGVIVYNGTGTSQDLEAAISKALLNPNE